MDLRQRGHRRGRRRRGRPWVLCSWTRCSTRFEPLPEGETRRDVLALADAAGVSVGEVYSVDASRRTTSVNAYVNGLGPTKRVVLFDTLLADYSREEVRFVVAHELGHVHHRDVPRQLLFLACARRR